MARRTAQSAAKRRSEQPASGEYPEQAPLGVLVSGAVLAAAGGASGVGAPSLLAHFPYRRTRSGSDDGAWIYAALLQPAGHTHVITEVTSSASGGDGGSRGGGNSPSPSPRPSRPSGGPLDIHVTHRTPSDHPAAEAPTGGRHEGFKSKAQWRKFFADPALKKWAKGKAHATPGPAHVRYDVLPARKGIHR